MADSGAITVQVVTVRVASCYYCPFCDADLPEPSDWTCIAEDEARRIDQDLCETTPIPRWCPLRTSIYSVELEPEA